MAPQYGNIQAYKSMLLLFSVVEGEPAAQLKQLCFLAANLKCLLYSKQLAYCTGSIEAFGSQAKLRLEGENARASVGCAQA